MRIYVFIAVLLLFSQLALGIECKQHNTPRIIMSTTLDLYEKAVFNLDVNSSVINNRTSFTFTHIDSGFANFKISKTGIISLIPLIEDIGKHKIMIIAVADNDCFDSALVIFNVFDRPSLDVTPKDSHISTTESEGVFFKASGNDTDSENLSFEWYLDDKLVKKGLYYDYFPNYNSSGRHNVTVVVTDDKSLKDDFVWKIDVNNVNRAPALVQQIPDIALELGADFQALNLNDYFIDPDYDALTFAYKDVEPEEDPPITLVDIGINIDNGLMQLDVPFTPGYRFVKFVAEDEYGISTDSNLIKLTALRTVTYSKPNFCGDQFCSNLENCETCPQDCLCEGDCIPIWECGPWESCQPTGLQIRACIDTNNCESDFQKPGEAKECIYVPTCEDGIRNQKEQRVDCGGPCRPCPTCFDRIQNQGETGIDCGGPCKTCPTCDDEITNQNETDIDCGGPCEACGPGGLCRTSFDCKSFICLENYCQAGTCEDGVRNQDEENKDCGGPCEVCPTCSDGIQNQREEDIDCGGPCEACPTCKDKIKNQDEFLIDCGGVCDRCSLGDLITFLNFKLFFATIIVLITIIILAIKKFSNPGYKSRKTPFSEKNKNLDMVIALNKFFRIFRFRKHKVDPFEATKATLTAMEEGGDKNKVLDLLLTYFSSVFTVNRDSDYDAYYVAIRKSKAPRLCKGMLVVLLRRMWLLKTENVVLPEQVARVQRKSIKILYELAKDL